MVRIELTQPTTRLPSRQLKPASSVTPNTPSSRASGSSSQTHADDASSAAPSGPEIATVSALSTDPSYYNPFTHGLLTRYKGQEYLNYFRTKMVPHFPFVVIPSTMSIEDLERDKPCLLIAILCVSSTPDPALQKQIGKLFNQLVSMRLLATKGWFTTIDLLQSLLVGLAWAHFQPRPLRYSQHLALASSIVADLRYDRPRIALLWSLNEDLIKSGGPKLTPDEMRALAGTYYLSSCASVLMQKAPSFKYTPYILDCCRKLTVHGGAPHDKYLSYIIYLQKLTEEVDEVVSSSQSSLQLAAELQRIKVMYLQTKATLPFVLSENPTIQLQIHILELLICQPSPDSLSIGPNSFRNVQGAANSTGLLDWLSQSISAAKNLINVLLLVPYGEEGVMPNLSWVCLYSTASLCVRLDLLAMNYDIGHLRRILDLKDTLRQIVLRLESLSGVESSPEAPRNAFFHLSVRARHVERKYLSYTSQPIATSSPDIGGRLSSSTSSPSSLPARGEAPTPVSFIPGPNLVPNMQITSQPDNSWTVAKAMEFDSDISMGNMLFVGQFDFLSDPGGGGGYGGGYGTQPEPVYFQPPPDEHSGANFDSGNIDGYNQP
ncbi:hypothetical protein BGZ63DRAFT_168442 [Mariannaea sp. PMI_226]|nr:hypothetical protein BGZ63DRAFT_168442 [Mariannaea sp. PMI_226]